MVEVKRGAGDVERSSIAFTRQFIGRCRRPKSCSTRICLLLVR